MIDSVIKLAEKVSELLKYRAERNARKFKNLIEPTYLALKQVHQDYMSIFEDLIVDLRSEKTISAIVESLQVRRRAEEAERQAILQQAKVILSSQTLSECHTFFEVVVHYFGMTPLSGGNTPSNMLLHKLRTAAQKESIILAPASRSPASERQNLARAIEFTLATLRRSWEEVAAEYAKALIENAK